MAHSNNKTTRKQRGEVHQWHQHSEEDIAEEEILRVEEELSRASRRPLLLHLQNRYTHIYIYTWTLTTAWTHIRRRAGLIEYASIQAWTGLIMPSFNL